MGGRRFLIPLGHSAGPGTLHVHHKSQLCYHLSRRPEGSFLREQSSLTQCLAHEGMVTMGTVDVGTEPPQFLLEQEEEQKSDREKLLSDGR